MAQAFKPKNNLTYDEVVALDKRVSKAWGDFYNANPSQRKFMGHRFADVSLMRFLSENSHGNVDTDRSYVVSVLTFVNVDAKSAGDYYDHVIYGNYAQTAQDSFSNPSKQAQVWYEI